MLSPLPLVAKVHLYPNDEIRYSTVLSNPRKGKKDISVINDCLQDKNGVIQKYHSSVKKKQSNSNAVKPGYGKLANGRKFTSYASQTIRRAGGAMQKEFGKKRLVLVTLTIPGSEEEITKAVAEYSGYIINRIQTWLGDNWKHSNGKKYSIGCVELQKRGMLHWHFVVALEDKRMFAEFKKKAQKFWRSILLQVSKLSGIDLFRRKKGGNHRDGWNAIKDVACRVEKVKKNAANYIAKYISKTESKYINGDKTISYTPSSWWSRSDDVVALMHAYTKVWETPPLSDEQYKTDVLPFLEETFNVYEMWQTPYTNPYTKQQIGIIARGTEKQCREWVEDILPVVLSIHKDNITYNELVSRQRWSKFWELEEAKEAEYRNCVINEGDAPKISKWGDRYRIYWRMIYQGFPRESALEYISNLKAETRLRYLQEYGCLVEEEWNGSCWEVCQV